jgi:Plant mobile domain
MLLKSDKQISTKLISHHLSKDGNRKLIRFTWGEMTITL